MTATRTPKYVTRMTFSPEMRDAWADLIAAIELQTGRNNPLAAYEAAFELAFRLFRHQITTVDYTHYLETKTWERSRQRALKRARYRCHLCSADMNLDVHHRTYERIGSEDDDDLLVLCRSCHSKFHGTVR